jgi:hypothetical protein
LHRRKSIVSSFMKEEEEEEEFHLVHSGSKGVEYEFLQPEHPQPGHVSIVVNILNNII